MNPVPASGHHLADVDGRQTVVLSNAQILSGKRIRADEAETGLRTNGLYEALLHTPVDPDVLLEEIQAAASNRDAERPCRELQLDSGLHTRWTFHRNQ